MELKQLKKIKLPNNPGVYFFYKGKNLLYIGKATSLKDRVKSYFNKDLINTRGPIILDMVTLSNDVKWQSTDSVLEALILEANLIKKHQPKYNTKEKDNKSFNYVCITKSKKDNNLESLPRVIVQRGRSVNKSIYQSVYGPFPNGLQLKEAMKIIRKIFPFMDDQSIKKNNKEFYKQLGLVPSIASIKTKDDYRSALVEYRRSIKNIKLFFEGKKKTVLRNLEKEMFLYAKSQKFEKANEIKKRIFALNHINDVSLIKEELKSSSIRQGHNNERIEAYDIAHMAGKNMVGVMTVIENGQLRKEEYRKFIIRTQGNANDTGALEEVLSRRLRHIEWGLPQFVVVDGGIAQINVAKSVLDRYGYKIAVLSVLKDERHKPKAIIGEESLVNKYKKDIILINSEAHRFAITFHKNKRNKNFLI